MDHLLSRNQPAYLLASFWIKWLLVLAILTSSFDIFLNVRIGFNFRFTQICIILSIALFAFTKKGFRFQKPLGIEYLLAWFFFIALFVPNGVFTRNAGYAVWLLFNILAVILFVQCINTPQRLIWLYKTYVLSFVAVSLFGIFQFVAPLLGLGAPLVEQWWVHGLVARANGFSYEPSYFATYLLMGWVITAYHLYNNAQEQRPPIPYLTLSHIIITTAILLSTSRMGIVILALWYTQYPVKFAVRLTKLRIKKKLFGINIGLLLLAGLLVLIIANINFEIILMLVNGTGLFGTATHSTTTGRIPTFVEVLEVFAKSPFIGYSLGGIASALAEHRNVAVSDLADLKQHEGMNVFAETLAASGVIGFIPFLAYIGSLFYRPLRLMPKITNPIFANMLKALVIALLFELVILQLNQNILRPYLWVHIAILAAAYSVTKRRLSPANHELEISEKKSF